MKSHTLKFCIVLCILNIIAIGFFIAIFTFIKTKVVRVAEVEAKANEQLQYSDANNSLKLLVDDIAPNMQKLSSRAVASDGAVTFIEEVESLATDSKLGIIVDSISTADVPDTPNYQSLLITARIQGTWQQVYRYLSLLQTLPYKISLTGVMLDSGVKGSWNGVVSFSVLQKT